MIRIAICDDDRFIHKQLAEIIMAYSIFTNEEINLLYFVTAEALLESTEKYDILFLDIRFNRKDIGIDIARKIRQKGSECIIILLTSLDTNHRGLYRRCLSLHSKTNLQKRNICGTQ